MNSPVTPPEMPCAPTPFTGPFTLFDAPAPADVDVRFDESLMAHAAEHGPAACIWQAPQGLVVPRTYLRSTAFDDACTAFKAQGWPISVRHSGGGVVPQGPGILNISLAHTIDGRPLDHSDAAYQYLCDLITGAVAEFGIPTHTQAVDGSFCDGRFNLATGAGAEVRKVAGTAQLWRRLPHAKGENAQVVLVHALLLVATDVRLATQQANALELALGHSRRYVTERAASLHELAVPAVSDTTHFTFRVRAALLKAILAS